MVSVVRVLHFLRSLSTLTSSLGLHMIHQINCMHELFLGTSWSGEHQDKVRKSDTCYYWRRRHRPPPCTPQGKTAHKWKSPQHSDIYLISCPNRAWSYRVVTLSQRPLVQFKQVSHKEEYITVRTYRVVVWQFCCNFSLWVLYFHFPPLHRLRKLPRFLPSYVLTSDLIPVVSILDV